MANFTSVLWQPRSPVTYTNLAAMSENDQYLKDLIEPAPRGVLGLSKKTSSAGTGSTTNAWSNPFGSTITFSVEANRYIRSTFFCMDIFGAGGTCLYSAVIKIDGTIVAQARATAENGYQRAMPPCMAVTTGLSAGSHTAIVEIAKINGPSGGSGQFEATSNSPMFLLVEDIGGA